MAIKELEKGGSSSTSDPNENCSSSLSEEEEEGRGGGEEKLEEERRGKDLSKGQSSRKKCRVEPNPEPCAHGYVGAINKMEGGELTWFCTKRLTSSDISRSQNRLLFPKVDTERLLGLLTQRERSELQQSQSTAGSKGVGAAVIDDMGRLWDMRLNFWASKSYNLNGDWRWLVKKLDLSEGDAVKVGAFRYPSSSESISASDEGRALGFVLRVENRRSQGPPP